MGNKRGNWEEKMEKERRHGEKKKELAEGN